MLAALPSLVKLPVALGLVGAVAATPVAARRLLVDPPPVGAATATAALTVDASARADEARYRGLAEIPLRAGRDDLEERAIELARTLRAVPESDGGAPCPSTRLRAVWDAPPDGAVHGAHLEPLGPAPGPDTDAVNGIVSCDGSTHAYMGFEAVRTPDGGWDLVAVPYLEDEGEPSAPHHPDDVPTVAAAPAPTPRETTAPRTEAPGRTPAAELSRLDELDLGPIDAYAAYEPQRTCSGSVKPGTGALRGLLLGRYPVTRDLGIVRGCSIGGRSEHKEGRAFDWGALRSRDRERAAVEDLLTRLLATDAAGNRHALARRMGVMYVIWDQRIWSAYRADAGWRRYTGTNPHTDHVHISLSWDGAMGRTSAWRALATGGSLDGLLLAAPALEVAPARGAADPAPAPSPTATRTAVTDRRERWDRGSPDDARASSDPTDAPEPSPIRDAEPAQRDEPSERDRTRRGRWGRQARDGEPAEVEPEPEPAPSPTATPGPSPAPTTEPDTDGTSGATEPATSERDTRRTSEDRRERTGPRRRGGRTADRTTTTSTRPTEGSTEASTDTETATAAETGRTDQERRSERGRRDGRRRVRRGR